MTRQVKPSNSNFQALQRRNLLFQYSSFRPLFCSAPPHFSDMGFLDKFRSEKSSIHEIDEKNNAGTSMQIPEGAKVDAVTGSPTFFGLQGTKLINAVSATATIGFLLFGYDQGVMAGLSKYNERDLPLFSDCFFPPCSHRCSIRRRVPRQRRCYSRRDSSCSSPSNIVRCLQNSIPIDNSSSLLRSVSVYELGCLAGAAAGLLYGDKIGASNSLRTRFLRVAHFTRLQVVEECFKSVPTS